MADPDVRAAALLEGPRGRRVCLETARIVCAPAAWEPHPLLSALFYAALEREPGSHVVPLTSRSETADGADAAIDRLPPAPAAGEIARLFDAHALPEPTEAQLLEALAASVNSARYWQEPDGADVLAGEPELRQPLRRVADLLVRSSATAWWSSGLDPLDQWLVGFEGVPASTPGTAEKTLATWRSAIQREEADWRRMADSVAGPLSGPWWSRPPRALLRTTRSLGPSGPVGLRLVEDSLGWREAEVRRVPVASTRRVLAIDSADDWAALCRRYPLEVTESRRVVWEWTTGRNGPWVLPDWSRVADDFAGVHLTVAGYLHAAGRAIPVEEGTAGVLAGWDPDQTFWLQDGAVDVDEHSQQWRNDDDGGWIRIR